MKKTFIIGHKNPDTDSVTAAISLSHLKNALGMQTEPRVLGDINKETQFVLNYFKISAPKFLDDVKVQIEDIDYKKNLMIDIDSSIYEAYTYMVDNGITGMPVVKNKNKFFGYVSLKELATDFIRGDFDYLNASYNNLIKVLEGKEITRFDEDIKGPIIAATYSSETFISDNADLKTSIIIVGKRKSIIEYCINKRAKMVILVDGHELPEDDVLEAKKNHVNIISTTKPAFEVVKTIGLSNYIKTIVRNETPVTFSAKDYLTDFMEVSNKLKHTNYPIVDKNKNCTGLLRLLDINHYERKNVILVDHNDFKQSVTGLNEANILEIIDHHALGNLTTNSPVSFRNMNVGSTNTIIYFLYNEAGIPIPKDIAGIMLSGILSDTLILKSPTTTPTDIDVTKNLAKIAELDIEKYGMEMLKAGSSLKGMSIEDVVTYDYKEYQANEMNFGIGQILTLDYDKILKKKEEYVDYLDELCETKDFKLITLFVTDIVNNGSYVLYSSNAKQIISLAYGVEDIEEGYYLDGVISRKKQMVPYIMEELENMN